jgi:hypothetical protein
MPWRSTRNGLLERGVCGDGTGAADQNQPEQQRDWPEVQPGMQLLVKLLVELMVWSERGSRGR